MIDASIIQKLSFITDEEKQAISGRKDIDRSLYMSELQDEIDSKKLLDSGKQVSLRTHTRFIHFPPHKHNYVEVVYMCQGQTTHYINGNEVVLKQGELLFIPQNSEQEILPAGESDIAVNFIILPEFFDTSLKMIGDEDNLLRAFIVSSLKGNHENVSYLHFQVSEVLPIQNLVENLIWTLLNDVANKRSINQITMGLLFLQLINHTEKIIVGESDNEAQLLLQIYRYIEERYKDAELTEIAKAMNYDLYWLSRVIKKKSGKNFKELLQHKRLNQAGFLLLNTTLSVEEIGHVIGYDNLSYFHRIFKERYMMTPKQYRTKITANKDTF